MHHRRAYVEVQVRVIVTGSCGYKGSMLVPALKLNGYEVIGIDTGWFGGNPDIKADFRTLKELPKADAIIHLANIANDPCGELDAKLTWEVNALGTVLLAELAVKAGIHRIIYASSASVYGIKGNEPVTEETSLEPVSDYNKTKMVAERILLSYSDRMNVQIVRPATVCGWSPRMRLDTIVNMLTYQALATGEIVAHCGDHGAGLMRPHTHIHEITAVYLWMLKNPESRGIFNAGFENLSVMDLAKRINKCIEEASWFVKREPAKISVTQVKDKRSYCVDSSKLIKAGFPPAIWTVDHAIRDIIFHFQGNFRESDINYNLKWMKLNGWIAG